MVATNFKSNQSIMNAKNNIAHKVQAALWCAQTEKRLIIGLNKAIQTLAETPSTSLFCILAQSKADDKKSMHIQEVLLETFCYENAVYVIKVDAAEKLARILGTRKMEKCVLIQKSTIDMDNVTTVENELINYCEELWDTPNKIPIALP